MRARGRFLPHGRIGPAALTAIVAALALAALVAAYVGVVLFVWLVQDRMMFYPRPAVGARVAPAGWRLETVRPTMADGTVLSGLLLLPPGPPAPLVVYFGGNAEEVTELAADAERTWGRRAVLLVNYRGYGASAGVPSEASFVADGVALVDAFSRRPDAQGSRVALHGRSLGTGVAVQVATLRPPQCVVLTSPFASARDIAREAFPWLPIRWLMRHPFDSLARAASNHVPLLVLAGDSDTLIASHHSRRLAQAWGGPAAFSLVHGGHNDLQDDPRYGAALATFLDAHL